MGSRPATLPRLLAALDRGLGAICAAAMVLVLPVSLLLFLQWPLREVVQAYSREANDVAQVLFALYIGIAVTYATRRGAHLAADALAHRQSSRVRRVLARVAAVLVLLPWSAFVVAVAAPIVWQSVRQLEGFPETFNPGYFLVKLAAALLALLVLLQALVSAVRPPGGDGR
jgi:TRAP-type C4-dicarboxylate transport system permease small subunit